MSGRGSSNPSVIGGGQPTGLFSSSSLLFQLLGANMNSTADQAFTKNGSFSKYIVDKIVVNNASISLTTVAGGIYTGAAKAGVAVVAAGQVYSALTAAAKTLGLTLAVTDERSEAGLNLSLTTAQGAGATADILVFGFATA